ncbi:MAG: BamA/TamA family outer membrane protein [Bacteroidota bacterium]
MKHMRSVFAFLLLSCWTWCLWSQTDSLPKRENWLVRTAKNLYLDTLPPEKPRFLVYPTLGYAPETRFEFGASALALFYAKQDHIRNRLSEVNVFTFITLERQYGIWLDHAIYGDRDAWFFLGKIRLQRFPLLYYGIGPRTDGENPNLIDANYLLLRERVLRKVRKNLFAGLEVDLQRLGQPQFEPEPIVPPPGAAGSTNVGLGLGLVYDDRHNVLNVRHGHFAEIAYLRYAPAWGSDFDFSTFTFEGRWFQPMNHDESQVLAAQVFGAFSGGSPPFNQLALLGGEQLMRGYYLGRYRDRQYMAAQVEYRFLPFPFSKRLGGAAFLAVGGVAPSIQDFAITNFQPTGGVGIRYLIFPSKDIFVRFDVGFTREGPGFYFFTGESF